MGLSVDTSRVVLLSIVFVQAFFFVAGSIYGWVALQNMLTDEGQYSSGCNNSGPPGNSTGNSTAFRSRLNGLQTTIAHSPIFPSGDLSVSDVSASASATLFWQSISLPLSDLQTQSLSDSDSSDKCSSQDSKLSLISSVAFNLANVATVVYGVTLDRFGIRLNSFSGQIIYGLGCVLLAYSDSESFDAFVAAYSLIAWGGIGTFLPLFQFANLSPSHMALLLTIFNALFNAAGLIYTGLYGLYQLGVPRRSMFLIYGICSFLFSFLVLAFYPDRSYRQGDIPSFPIAKYLPFCQVVRSNINNPGSTGKDEEDDDVEEQRIAEEEKNSDRIPDSVSPKVLQDSPRSDAKKTKRAAQTTRNGASYQPLNEEEETSRNQKTPSSGSINGDDDEMPSSASLSHSLSTSASKKTAIVDLEAPSSPLTGGTDLASPAASASDDKETKALKEELKDPVTWWLSFYFSFGLLYTNFYNAHVGTQLDDMGDDNHNYSNAFIFIMSLFPIVFAPVFTYLLKRVGYTGLSLIGTSLLPLPFACLFLSSLPFQLFAFFIYAISRQFIISILFTYVATQYRQDHYGYIIGFATLIASCVGFLQLLMDNIAIDQLNSNFTPVNVWIMCTYAPFFYFSYLLHKRGK